MLRIFITYRPHPWALIAMVALSTLLLGFVTQAAGSLYLRWTDDPITLSYKTTLSYTSALIGDAILLPIVNTFIFMQLSAWKRRPHLAEVIPAILGGGALTIGVHLYQAANELLNWTMTQPYAWSPLGYVHAAFMFTELSLVLFFWGQVAQVTRDEPQAIFSHRILIVVLSSLFFLRLLLGDYGYFS